MKKKLISVLAAAGMCISAFTAAFPVDFNEITAYAAADYPVQEFRLGMADTDNNVASSGAALVPSETKGTNNEKWSLNYISSGVYEIVNSDTGKILTANGSSVSLADDKDGASQRWKIEGVQKDYDGYYLYYKITSNADTSKALTYTEGAGFGLSSYSGGDYQKYKLNLDGLEGFAANCKTSSGEKAGTIGGLLGEVVYVSTADELEKQLNTVGAQTIVITADIDMQKKGNTRIRDNKTIVGSYSKHTVYDSQFRTNDAYGAENDSPSDNIVFRNLDMEAKNVPNRILINIWSSRQIWIDHINFNSQLSYDRTGNGQDEVGKFIWINTPYESYRDAKDRLRSPDYVTISYCKLTHRYWTVAYGTQNDEITRDRTTLLYNWWNEDVRRCPQLGNGSAHVYNNYYSAYGSNNGSATTGIIGGDGSEMLSQNNRFQGYTAAQALTMGGDANKNPARDDNSYLATETNGTPSAINFQSKNTSKWYPEKSNYGYELLDAYNTKGTDTKDFCTKYAGCFSSKSGIKYITDADFAGWISKKYSSPFLRHVDLGTAVVAAFDNGSAYRIKNVNSGLYMQVEGAKAENGTNVQQWGTADGVTHDIWKVLDAGDGYCYLVSAVGDAGTYVLDVAGRKTANGTNVDIYTFNGGDNQQFMLTKNADGSYKIRTKISGGKSAVEIANAGTGSGDNVQQWEINGANCQDWILEPVANPGSKMDTKVVYEFQNVNSGMVMDIEAGNMAENTNVQQWTTGHFKSQQWTLQEFSGGGNYYYIRSYSDPSYVLKAESGANGGNIDIVPYSTKDSMMLFKFSKNPDGTYYIYTRASKDACLVEIASASTASGANVAQWSPTNNDCQKWSAETFTTTVTTTTTTTVTTTTATEATTTTAAADTTTAAAEETTVTVSVSTEAVTTTETIETTTVSDETQQRLAGDANNDGKVSISDAIAILQYLANSEKYPLNGICKINADVDGEEGVTGKDAAIIQAYDAGVITVLS
ncbi:MAG: RICIN domain-containing protein [Ruminococcus sp.]|nr:RICIN domain-containing protein [Ruminococcus sp.]